MSNDTASLGLRLKGPLQSWGSESLFNRRNTALFPSKSAILGLCCAAMGIPRGSPLEEDELKRLRRLSLLVVAISHQRQRPGGTGAPLVVRRITDFHTVENTLNAEGRKKQGAELTWRQYLCDASFVAVLSGDKPMVKRLSEALRDPVWGVWLGRKACLPAVPVFAGLYNDEREALDALLGGRSLESFSYQREVERLEDGTDTIRDQPLCFGGRNAIRAYAPRRIRTVDGAT